jgi:hypothetical protein
METPYTPTPSVFDFQGIPYAWGGKSYKEGLDCFGLTNQVYRKFNCEQINGYDWVYGEYGSDSDLPTGKLAELCDTLEREESQVISTLDLVLIDWWGKHGLGVIVEHMNQKYVVYTGSAGTGTSAFIPLRRIKQRIVKSWKCVKGGGK